MVRDKFDKELVDRLYHHEMQPDDAVWSHIEATLDVAAPIYAPISYRRKILTFATITSVAAALLLSFLLIHNNEKPTEKIVNLPLAEKRNEETTPQIGSIVKEEPIVALAVQSKQDKAVKRQIVNTENSETNIYDSVTTEQQPEIQETQPTQRTQKTRSTAVAQNYPNHPKQSSAKKSINGNGKNHLSISVSGSGNFSSSSSTTGNNTLVRPLKAINENNIISLYASKNRNRKWEHNMPLAFSVTIQKMFTKRIGIETGLTYTYLSSTSKGESILDQNLKQQFNYLGIPLSVVYSIIEGKKFGLYAKGGFLVDKAISAKGTSKIDGTSQSMDVSTKGVQFSALLQVGASYNLTNYMSLYLEPTGNYYFDSKQPISYRTENDFGFTAMVGLRFKL